MAKDLQIVVMQAWYCYYFCAVRTIILLIFLAAQFVANAQSDFGYFASYKQIEFQGENIDQPVYETYIYFADTSSTLENAVLTTYRPNGVILSQVPVKRHKITNIFFSSSELVVSANGIVSLDVAGKKYNLGKPISNTCKALSRVMFYTDGLNPVVDNFASESVDDLDMNFDIDKNSLDSASASITVIASKRSSSSERYLLVQKTVYEGLRKSISIPINGLESGNWNITCTIDTKGGSTEVYKYFLQKIKSTNYVAAPKYEAKTNSSRDFITSANRIKQSWVAAYPFATLQKNALSMQPICTKMESSIIDKLVDAKSDTLLRNFFYNFWVTKNAENPEQEWKNYAKQLNYVAKQYGSGGLPGYSTDRGRVYLKYGEPSILERVLNEKGAVPYEIWVYSKLEVYDDVYFIFIQQGSMGGDFKLLHSNLPGERFTSTWRQILLQDPESENHRIFEYINKGGR
jgi:GWxTD domain-containing protein